MSYLTTEKVSKGVPENYSEKVDVVGDPVIEEPKLNVSKPFGSKIKIPDRIHEISDDMPQDQQQYGGNVAGLGVLSENYIYKPADMESGRGKNLNFVGGHGYDYDRKDKYFGKYLHADMNVSKHKCNKIQIPTTVVGRENFLSHIQGRKTAPLVHDINPPNVIDSYVVNSVKKVETIPKDWSYSGYEKVANTYKYGKMGSLAKNEGRIGYLDNYLRKGGTDSTSPYINKPHIGSEYSFTGRMSGKMGYYNR